MKISKFAGQNSAIFTIYDENHFYGYVRRRVFDFEELLASLGGFLGLIRGLSVISVIEIFYFIVFHRLKPSSSEENHENLEENICKETIVSFGSSSTIHGMNHVSDSERSVVEK